MDEIEIEGQKLAEERLGSSDIVICVVDSLKLFASSFSDCSTILDLLSNAPEMSHPALKKLIMADAPNLMILLNKYDLLSSEQQRWLAAASESHGRVLCISCKTRAGVPQMTSTINSCLKRMLQGNEDSQLSLLPTRARHQELLTSSLFHLQRFLGLLVDHIL